jgi:proteasome lid subunit RPN8/RPN11
MDQVVKNREWLVRRAIQGAPHELCGFIMVDGSVVEIPNAASDPHRDFSMARHHLVERVPNPQEVYAIWHTHPNGNPQPSLNDMRAVKCGAIQPHWIYLIVTSSGVYEHIMELEHDESITVRTHTR